MEILQHQWLLEKLHVYWAHIMTPTSSPLAVIPNAVCVDVHGLKEPHEGIPQPQSLYHRLVYILWRCYTILQCGTLCHIHHYLRNIMCRLLHKRTTENVYSTQVKASLPSHLNCIICPTLCNMFIMHDCKFNVLLNNTRLRMHVR